MGIEAGPVLLATAYGSVCMFCIVQVCTIWCHRHMLLSFRVGFLSLSAIWTGLRAIFWLAPVAIGGDTWILVFNDLPIVGQLSSYLLVLVFCAQQLHSHTWHSYGWRCWMLFVGAVVAALCTVIGMHVTSTTSFFRHS